jgi:hypothetical protein
MTFKEIEKINGWTLVDYWKDNGLKINDFYCRECGKFMVDVNDIVDVRYKPDATRSILKLVVVKNGVYRQYVENEHNRWLVRGRELSGKTFFRKVCWDCFFKHLPEIENISKRALKSSWYKDVKSGIFRPPAAWTSPSKYFKLLFDITDEELEVEHRKFDTASLESFIKRHGEVEGRKKYEEYTKRQAYTCSKEYMMGEKGMTEEEWNKFNQSRAVTKENLILRHGTEVGTKMWEDYCERQAYAGCKLEYFVEKYGKEKGLEEYRRVCKDKRITYDNFIKKYGENEGALKWISYVTKKNNNYSGVSVELFYTLDEMYEISRINSRYGDKNNGELSLNLEIGGEHKLVSLDYTLFDKVIEFYGDFYHANPKRYREDDIILTRPAKLIWEKNRKRIEAIEKAGYKVKIVWEGDFYKDPKRVISECLDFLKS